MTNVINAEHVGDVTGRRILLDANIWIMLEGFSASADRRKVDIYSDAYSRLRQVNEIVINDYILGEFCNRCAKLEYEAHIRSMESPPAPDSFQSRFKHVRRTPEFAACMESVRDTCLNLLDDCSFIPVSAEEGQLGDVLEGFCSGKLDFSDLVIIEACRKHNVTLMTDDGDFADCGLPVITANRRLLGAQRALYARAERPRR